VIRITHYRNDSLVTRNHKFRYLQVRTNISDSHHIANALSRTINKKDVMYQSDNCRANPAVAALQCECSPSLNWTKYVFNTAATHVQSPQTLCGAVNKRVMSRAVNCVLQLSALKPTSIGRSNLLPTVLRRLARRSNPSTDMVHFPSSSVITRPRHLSRITYSFQQARESFYFSYDVTSANQHHRTQHHLCSPSPGRDTFSRIRHGITSCESPVKSGVSL